MRHLQLQLSYVYNQIISVLTLTSLNKIFKQRVNYDLRRMLTGTEKFIDNILKVMDNDTSYLLGSVRCLPLNPSIRDTITQTLLQCCKVKVTFLSGYSFFIFSHYFVGVAIAVAYQTWALEIGLTTNTQILLLKRRTFH